MLIGVPKEIKNHEYRIGMTPMSVREAVRHGHQVLVQEGAGIGIGGAVLLYRSVDMSLYIPNFVSFKPEPETLIGAFVLSIIVGIVSVMYSTYRVTGLTIAEALRSTE